MILSSEIEKLEQKPIQGERTVTKIKMLKALRKKYPELDRADESLAIVKKAACRIHYFAPGCDADAMRGWSYHSDLCKEAKTLVAKIEKGE